MGSGKAMVNLLPLSEGERISTILPLPEIDRSGRNSTWCSPPNPGACAVTSYTDFVSINRNGKIAMKLDEGDGIVGVEICTEHDDILLTTRSGKCIRFQAGEVRVFKGRNSAGVRGIKLADGDEVVSLSLLHHSDVGAAEIETLPQASKCRASCRNR